MIPRSVARIQSPSCMSIARSIALRNSRMLPGQVWACNADAGIRLKPLDLAPELTVVKGNKVLRQRHDIVFPTPKRRDRHLNYVEAVVEVKGRNRVSLLDRLSQVAVRGRDHTQVDLQILGASQAPKLLPFEYTQELRLQRQGKLTDFIKKDRSAAGEFQQHAALLISRVGKRRLFRSRTARFPTGFRG